MKKWTPTVLQNSSSTSNFFTKWAVAFHFWKAIVHFVKIKKINFFSPDPTHLNCYFFRFFSLSPLISSENFSLFFSFALSSLCSLFSFCSFGLLGFLLKHSGGLGLPVIRWWWLIRLIRWWWLIRLIRPGRERPTPRSRPGRERPTPRPGLAVPDPNGLAVPDPNSCFS